MLVFDKCLMFERMNEQFNQMQREGALSSVWEGKWKTFTGIFLVGGKVASQIITHFANESMALSFLL